MATQSPDVTWRFNKAIDQGISAQLSGIGLNGVALDSLMVLVKAYLDANLSQFKVDGQYTQPHIRQAITTVMARGT